MEEDEFERDFGGKGKIMDEICEKFEEFRKDLSGEWEGKWGLVRESVG